MTRPFGNFFNVEWHVVGLTKKKGKRVVNLVVPSLDYSEFNDTFSSMLMSLGSNLSKTIESK